MGAWHSIEYVNSVKEQDVFLTLMKILRLFYNITVVFS